MKTFEELLVELQKCEVRYILVGGLAVDYAGFHRSTMDVDIIIDADHDNVKKLLSVLERFGDGYASELSPEDFPLEEGSVRVVEDFPVDIFTQMRGELYGDLQKYVQLSPTSLGIDIPHLSPQGLILLKETSTRNKDIIDVLEMKRIIAERDAAD